MLNEMCNFTRVDIILDQRCLWQISRLSPIWKSEWREAITLAGSNCRISSLHKSAIFAANMEPCKTGHKMAWNDRKHFQTWYFATSRSSSSSSQSGSIQGLKGGLERLPTSSLLCHPLKGSSGTCVKVNSDATNPKHKSLKGLVGSPPNLPQVPCPWLKRFGFAAHQLSWWARVEVGDDGCSGWWGRRLLPLTSSGEQYLVEFDRRGISIEGLAVHCPWWMVAYQTLPYQLPFR